MSDVDEGDTETVAEARARGCYCGNPHAGPCAEGAKPSNPKQAAAHDRATFAIPLVALVEEGLALFEGALKYGWWNYTVAGARSSTYVFAAFRHIFKWYCGQTHDPVSGIHHLGNARACLGVIMECEHRGILTDDRPPAVPELDALFERVAAVMQNLITLYGARDPRHYTIADTRVSPPADTAPPSPNAYTEAERARIASLVHHCARCPALLPEPGICDSCLSSDRVVHRSTNRLEQG
jgi:hypothetical protein